MSTQVRRGDWVRTKESRVIGFVRRVARDGSWADVRWRDGGAEWSKRMPTWALIVEHTIPFMGMYITDMTRQKELEG